MIFLNIKNIHHIFIIMSEYKTFSDIIKLLMNGKLKVSEIDPEFRKIINKTEYVRKYAEDGLLDTWKKTNTLEELYKTISVFYKLPIDLEYCDPTEFAKKLIDLNEKINKKDIDITKFINDYFSCNIATLCDELSNEDLLWLYYRLKCDLKKFCFNKSKSDRLQRICINGEVDYEAVSEFIIDLIKDNSIHCERYSKLGFIATILEGDYLMKVIDTWLFINIEESEEHYKKHIELIETFYPGLFSDNNALMLTIDIINQNSLFIYEGDFNEYMIKNAITPQLENEHFLVELFKEEPGIGLNYNLVRCLLENGLPSKGTFKGMSVLDIYLDEKKRLDREDYNLSRIIEILVERGDASEKTSYNRMVNRVKQLRDTMCRRMTL